MGLLSDYTLQAQTYDRTRGASPSVLGPLRAALAGSPGRRLADVGGGTGNYANALRGEGWDPLVIDRAPGMLARARAKGLATLNADAEHLPLADETFDAVMLVSMLHHVDDPARALAEARRILRVEGRLVLMVFTREDMDDLWLLEYFPSTRAWVGACHLTLAETLALLPGAETRSIVFGDLTDASLGALASSPEKLLHEDWRAQTSYFERLQRDHPRELDEGLQRLERDLACGAAPIRPGRASLLAWRKDA